MIMYDIISCLKKMRITKNKVDETGGETDFLQNI